MVERATGEGGSRGGGEKGSMDGTRSPQPKGGRGARCARRIRARLAGASWSTASRGVPSLDLFPFRPFGTARDRRATTRSCLPASTSPRPRTTSDVAAAPREMHGARMIGVGSKLDAGDHGTVLNERALVSPFSRLNADAPWSGIDLLRAMTVDEGPSRSGTRTAPNRRSAVKSRHARHARIRRDSPFRVNSPHAQSRAEPLPWRSNDVRTSCEVDSRRPRGARFPVVARRSRTVVQGRRGKRSRDGTRSQQ